MITLPQLPTWAVTAYFVFLVVVLVASAVSSRRHRRPVQHAARRGGLWRPTRSNLWRTGPEAGPVPVQARRTPAPDPETRPLQVPADTVPLALAGARSVVANGTIVVCPLCGGGRLAGRILLPSKPGCVWCHGDGGVA